MLDNPTRFCNAFQVNAFTPLCARVARPTYCSVSPQFEVSFECLTPMSEDIEWKLIYVGSAESDEHDQELDSILVGPMQASATVCAPLAAHLWPLTRCPFSPAG